MRADHLAERLGAVLKACDLSVVLNILLNSNCSACPGLSELGVQDSPLCAPQQLICAEGEMGSQRQGLHGLQANDVPGMGAAYALAGKDRLECQLGIWALTLYWLLRLLKILTSSACVLRSRSSTRFRAVAGLTVEGWKGWLGASKRRVWTRRAVPFKPICPC